MTEVTISPEFRADSISGVWLGSLWKSAIGIVRVLPSGSIVSISASSARIATAISDGWVAMQESLAPRIACIRLNPPIAEHPDPGSRLLQPAAVS